MLKGTYKGNLTHLIGETAIVQRTDPYGRFAPSTQIVYVQFDNLNATNNGSRLAHGWHGFITSDWDITGEEENQPDPSENDIEY